MRWGCGPASDQRSSAPWSQCSLSFWPPSEPPCVAVSISSSKTCSPAPPTRRPDPPDPQALRRPCPRQAGVGRRPPPLPRLAAPPRAGPARDRRRVAPRRLAAVLAVALALPARPSPVERRGARPHRHDRLGRSVVGHRTDPGELLELGIAVSSRSIRRYRWRPNRPPGQAWRTFLRNHRPSVWAADLLTVQTLTFRTLYVLVFIA